MPQPVSLSLHALNLRTMLGKLLLAGAPRIPQPFDVRSFILYSSEGVEQPAMGRHFNQRPFIMLTMDLHQGGSQATQCLRANRLVIYEGAGASVGELDAPQDQLVVCGRNAIHEEEIADRMPRRQLEYRGDLTLLSAVSHKRGISTSPERKRKSIEQNRFSGAGLAGENRQAGGKFDIQPIDEHNVTNGEPDQHA